MKRGPAPGSEGNHKITTFHASSGSYLGNPVQLKKHQHCNRPRCTEMRSAKIRTIGWTACSIAMLLNLTACATAPMDRAGSLKSYRNLTVSDGALTKSLLRVDKDGVLAANTVRIIPTEFSRVAVQVPVSEEQRKLVANGVDRSLCVGLSDRFQVVSSNGYADLTVHATITHVEATDETVAGISKAVSFVPAFLNLGFPVIVPRIPLGLGNLSLEAEAYSSTGDQKAAMIWGRGAAFLSPKASKVSDAYDLATEFGSDFSKLLVTGDTPFVAKPSIPSFQRINSSFGGAPKYSACEAFGRDPGLIGMVGSGIGGMPPEWTDRGARPNN
jgi:hypothetical protein